MPCKTRQLLAFERKRPSVRFCHRRGSKEERQPIPASGLPAGGASHCTVSLEHTVITIGIDPHKGSHTNIRRFPTGGHYARDNGTAPLEASSGPRTRHRLNPRGNRQLNHAIHTAALTQIAHDHPGRAYHERKQAEGNTNKEAMRALKRRISDVV